jgi:hypothetical protein
VIAATTDGRAAPPTAVSLTWTSRTGDVYGPGDGKTRTYSNAGYVFDIGALAIKSAPTHIDIIVASKNPAVFPNPGIRFGFEAPGVDPMVVGKYTVGSILGIHTNTTPVASANFNIDLQPGCASNTPGGTLTVTRASYETIQVPDPKDPTVLDTFYHPLAFQIHFELQCASTNGLMIGDFSMVDAPIPGATPYDPSAAGGTGGGTGGTGGTGGSGTPSAGPTVVLSDEVMASPVVMANAASVDVPFTTYIPTTVTGDVTLSAVTDADNLLASVSPSLIKAGAVGDAVLTIRTTEATTAGDHVVTITASDGVTPSSASVFVTVACDPPFILGLDQPKSPPVSAGRPALLSVKASGSGPFIYQWFTGASGLVNFPLAGGTTPQFTTSALNDTTSYWVRVTNPCGSVDSQTVTVNVAAAANVNPRH